MFSFFLFDLLTPPFPPPPPPPPPPYHTHTHLTARKIKIKKNEKGLEISSFSYVYQKLYSFSDMVLDGRTDGQRRTDGPMEKVIELGAPPNKKNIALQNHAENEAERLVRDLFLFFQNVLYEVKAKGLQLSFNISIFFMLYSINWSNFIVWLHLLLDILTNTWTAIVCEPGFGGIKFEIYLIFLSNHFSTCQKSYDKNLNILRTKGALKVK